MHNYLERVCKQLCGVWMSSCHLSFIQLVSPWPPLFLQFLWKVGRVSRLTFLLHEFILTPLNSMKTSELLPLLFPVVQIVNLLMPGYHEEMPVCQLPGTQHLRVYRGCILHQPAVEPSTSLLPGLLHATLYILMKQMMQHSALADHQIQGKNWMGMIKPVI